MLTRFFFRKSSNWNATTVLLVIVVLGTSCSTASHTSQPSVPVNNGDIQNNLLILSPDGVRCKMDSFSKIPGALVLRKAPSTYNGEEIDKLTQYVNAAFTAAPAPVPDGFQVLLAGSLGTPGLCQETIEITNNGNASVQITNINMKLLTNPQPDTAQYKLINICSLKVFVSPCPTQGQGGSPEDFQYHVALDNAKANTLLHTQLYRNEKPSNIGPTLDSGDSVDVLIAFETTKVHYTYQYSVFPEIAIESVGKQYVLPVRQLKSVFTLFSGQNLSCYSSNGTTFISLSRKNSWCL